MPIDPFKNVTDGAFNSRKHKLVTSCKIAKIPKLSFWITFESGFIIHYQVSYIHNFLHTPLISCVKACKRRRCIPPTWAQKLLMKHSGGILRITRSANLPTSQLRPMWWGGREETGVGSEEDDSRGGRFGGYHENNTKKKRLAASCQQGSPPTRPHLLLPQHSPCDHVGSEAEHESANEGADLPRRSLPSPLLLFQAPLANTGNTARSAGS